jgi:hypothetical protein
LLIRFSADELKMAPEDKEQYQNDSKAQAPPNARAQDERT